MCFLTFTSLKILIFSTYGPLLKKLIIQLIRTLGTPSCFSDVNLWPEERFISFLLFKNLLRCVPECSDLCLTSNPSDYCIQPCPFWFYTTAPVWFCDR